MDVPTLFATAAASAAGAGVTGLIGFRIALARLRRERAFNHRIEWYQSTIRKLSATARYFVFLAKTEQLLPDKNPDKLTEAVLQMLALFDVRQEGELYATTHSYDALEPVLDAVQDLMLLLSQGNLNPDSPRYPELLDAIASASYVIGEAASSLIDDMRKELGLGKLHRRWTWDRRADEDKLRQRIHLHDLIEGRAEGEWAFLNLDLIERVLSRTNDAISPDERLTLAEELESYARQLRGHASPDGADKVEAQPNSPAA